MTAAPDPIEPMPGEFYADEHGRVVFTAAYHLRRGYCCGNACRHCPWRDDADGRPPRATL